MSTTLEHRLVEQGPPRGRFTVTYLVHEAFRRDLLRLSAAVCLPRPDAAERSPALADHWEFVSDQLHHHHSAEDESLWPPVRSQIEDCPDDVAVLDDRQPLFLAHPDWGRFEEELADRQGPVKYVAQQLFSGQDTGQGHLLAGDDRQPALGRVRGGGVAVDRRRFHREVDPADASQVDGQVKQVGAVRERRQRPGEGEGEVVIVRGVGPLG